MRRLSLALILLSLFSCTKGRKACYECDITVQNTGVYTHVGCYTDEEWRTGAIQTDVAGNPIDKGTRCREEAD